MNKRIIPCLDIRDGRVVKGKKFKDVQDVADPVTLAKNYETDRADQLFLLDISGDDRKKFLSIVRQIADEIDIPLYVGGGIRTLEDIEATLNDGAAKVSITSAAIDRPAFLKEAVAYYGSQRIILSIDAKRIGDHKWHAFTKGGKQDSKLDVIDWAKRGEDIGVSEILLNSIDADGVKNGFDIALNKAVSEAVQIPVIASGGAGEKKHFKTVFAETNVQAALAASIFHYGEISITDLKQYLLNFQIPVEEIEQ